MSNYFFGPFSAPYGRFPSAILNFLITLENFDRMLSSLIPTKEHVAHSKAKLNVKILSKKYLALKETGLSNKEVAKTCVLKKHHFNVY